MSNTMEYKGYVGSVEFSEKDGVFFGKVMGIRAMISYEGENAHDLVEDFHSAVDSYLETCAAEGIEPEKAYKGHHPPCGTNTHKSHFWQRSPASPSSSPTRARTMACS